MANAPTIDLNAIDEAALAAIDAACRDHGFFLLKGHGLEKVSQDMWAESEKFFAQGHEIKSRVMRTEDYPLGYYDRELTKRIRDNKEVFDFFIPPEGSDFQVVWPEGLSEFRAAMEAFHKANAAVAGKVLGLICRALGVNETAIDAAFERGHSSTTRINHYPAGDPVPGGEAADLVSLGDLSLGPHTDPGAITLLMQDDVGGLQAWSRRDDWFDVEPVPGTIVINVGDMMQVWSNDLYKSAQHRVVRHPQGKSRYSTPFFYNPHSKTVIGPLSDFGVPKFDPIPWSDYIGGRVADNYADIGEDDIQIERFRLAI